ncbi:hypothetical protein NXS19_001830 [Fusarium pseudograminearum]|nr:hypothetical protein NXS19_001830 [Fusarium pseudograminearum]
MSALEQEKFPTSDLGTRFKAAGASTAECSTMEQFEVAERTVTAPTDWCYGSSYTTTVHTLVSEDTYKSRASNGKTLDPFSSAFYRLFCSSALPAAAWS